MGAEHIEYPNDIPEDDDTNCRGSGRFCAQYSLGEAPHYTDPDIPAWRACNAGSPSWSTQFEPYEVTVDANGLHLMYEGKLTKQGDFGGSTNGANCHEDYLFSGGQRRPVYLRVGYDLEADAHFVDRLMQVRNPDGNPPVDGPHGFIGGFVMTAWPNPHPLKQLNTYIRVDEQNVNLDWGRTINVTAGDWIALPDEPHGADVVLGWARQPVTLSAFPDYVRGQSFTLSNHGEGENGDSGMCLCTVHGAIEMGGGLISEAVAGGALSPMGRRRLTLRHEVDAPTRFERTYQAESDLQHHAERGRADADGWSANNTDDTEGHLLYGPYARDWPGVAMQADFRMLIDFVDSREEVVATIEVYDADADEILASRDVRRVDFNAAFAYQDFSVDFDMSGRQGHRMETRVFWARTSYMRVDRIVVRER